MTLLIEFVCIGSQLNRKMSEYNGSVKLVNSFVNRNTDHWQLSE